MSNRADANGWHREPTPADGEAGLVQAARKGDRRAFDALVERYDRRAVSVAYRLVGSLDDALEVTQEAFIRAYRGLGTLTDAERFGPWLLRIVTNLALNHRRDRAVGGPRLSLDQLLDDSRPGIGVHQPDPHSETPAGRDLDTRELNERVREAVLALPDLQRTAFVLFAIEGLPQKDVAAIMRCSIEAVKWHVFQARRLLRDALAEYL